MISDAEKVAIELHRALRIVAVARARFADMPVVPRWIDLPHERRRLAIDVVETLIANGTIAVGPGRDQDVKKRSGAESDDA